MPLRWVAKIKLIACKLFEVENESAQRRCLATVECDLLIFTSMSQNGVEIRATPSRIAMAREMRDLIASALADMPEDYRTVIQLLDRRRTSVEEAGELMGRTANAIKKLHPRALAELARRLGLDEGTSA